MACSKSTNNVVLMHLTLLFFSLGLCINSKKWNIQKHSRNPHGQYGTLIVGLKTEKGRSKKATVMDYQSDMVWNAPEHQEYGFPGYDNAAVQRLLQMNPTVYCSDGHMRLQVDDADSKPGALLFVDRGNLLPLSPSKLPKSCGYEVSSTRRDFVMKADYDSCFVLAQESCHVLPLRWLGLLVQMSCPVTPPSAPMPKLICLPWGMIVTFDWTTSLSEIKVNLNGQWEPLTQFLSECRVGRIGTTEDSEEPTLYFPYNSPCVRQENGKFIMKLYGDAPVNLPCPLQTSASYLQLMMNEQISNPGPTQTVQTTAQQLHFDDPQSPSSDRPPFYSFSPGSYLREEWPRLPFSIGGSFPSRYFVQHTPYVPWLYPLSPYSFNQRPERPPHREHPPMVDMPSFSEQPPWIPSEPPRSLHFDAPPGPVWPVESPQPTASIKPEPSPTYSCPFPHSTEKPKVTAPLQVTVPQNYPLFRPYPYPPALHFPHSTTAPTPSTRKPQDRPMSRPGTEVVFPEQSQTDITQTLGCIQQCDYGLFDCCPHISFHQHFNFLPQHQNGDLQVPQVPQVPLPGQPTEVRSDLLQPPPQEPQEAPGPPSRTTFTNTLFSPESYRFEGLNERPFYYPPQEGSPVAFPGRQTDSPPAHEFFSYGFDTNLLNSHVQPEQPSTGTVGRNLFSPYVPSSDGHQSDGAPSNAHSPSVLANNGDVMNEPALVFGSRHVPYGRRQEQHISNNQPEAQMTPRGFVLLQQGPPGRESTKNIFHSAQ